MVLEIPVLKLVLRVTRSGGKVLITTVSYKILKFVDINTISFFINILLYLCVSNMPKGKPYTKNEREQIFYNWQQGRTPEEIHQTIFLANTNGNRSSLAYVNKLCLSFTRNKSIRLWSKKIVV